MQQIIFLGLNYDQLPYLKILKKHKYKIIGIDRNINAPGARLVDRHIARGYDEYSKIEEIVKNDDTINPSAIFTASAQFSHVLAAKLSKHFGLHYPDESLINNILDKSKFYKLFTDHGLPIPPTQFIYSSEDLAKCLSSITHNKKFFLKSDFSKNPKYVYSGTSKELLETSVNWLKDTHLRSCYVLQPEIQGKSLRINVMEDGFEAYDFYSGLEITSKSDNLIKIVGSLRSFCKALKINHWIIKFDVIETENSFAALDIGIDPPARMLAKYKKKNLNFEEYYLKKYLSAFE